MKQGHIKRLFIPIVVALCLLAVYVYLFSGTHRTRSIREAVPVEKFTLGNGLTVVVMPSDRVPAVAHLMVVKAGAADDLYGRTGVAHYLEHLLFTGSKNYPEGSYDSTVRRLGGEQNAYTTKDYTAYYAVVAKEHLPTVMAMEADRLQHLNWDADKVARELKVITEERNQRIENHPAAQFAEQMEALTFLNHPYHHPTIGWAEDMATLTQEDAQAFFNTYYRASNMVLVLAGDITLSEARRHAQRYYGSLPAGAAPKRDWPKEPPLRLTRRATMEDATIREPQLLRQYIAPSLNEGDAANALPLALFAQYLGGGPSSVLYQQLVRDEKLAATISVDYDAFARGPELFRISAIPNPGVTLEQLEAALDRALDAAMRTAPDEAALTRAKTRLKAEAVYAQDGLFPLANLIASLYAIGLDEQVFYDWPTRIEAISAPQAQEAARAVLAPKRRITGYLKPTMATPAPDAPAPAPTEAPDAP